MDKKEINHQVELIMARMDKAIKDALPTEFLVEVPDEHAGKLQFKLTVLAYCGENTTWEAMKARFETATQMNPQFNEVRIKPYGDYVLLCGVKQVSQQ